jgi:GINS complex protein
VLLQTSVGPTKHDIHSRSKIAKLLIILRVSTQLGSSPLVTLDFPSALSQRVINALKADPNTVDLRAQASHFYALGARILELFEEEEIVDVLLDVRWLGPLQC